jgi:hypothetical protein
VSEPSPQRPYDNLFDTEELKALEGISPGSADFVLGMIKIDMQWQAARQDRLDRWDHSTRILSIWATLIVVSGITAAATGVILAGHAVAGSILAGADLVALANVFINAAKRT